MVKSLVALLIFSLFYCALGILIARKGWNKFFSGTFDSSPRGERVVKTSAVISGVTYGLNLVLWVDEEGLWIRPKHIFRVGHRCAFLSYENMKSVTETGGALQDSIDLFFVRKGCESTIRIPLNSRTKRLKNEFEEKLGSSSIRVED